MLSRPIYEMLPYLYMGFGALVFWVVPPGLAHAFGILLYAMGALVWVLRSNARRVDRHRHRRARSQVGHPLFVSFALYELYPFVVSGLALWLMGARPSWAVITLGAVIVTYAVWLVVQRAEGRGHGWITLVDWHQGLFR